MILAPVALAIAAKPSLAFVARFYKSGSAKSRMEIYVSDLSGANRKQLATTEEPNFVQWVGHDRLVWNTQKGLWTSKLSPWKPVKVSSDTNLGFQESRYRTWAPGSPSILRDYGEAKGIWNLNPKTLKLEQIVPTPTHDEVTLDDEKKVEVANPSSPEHPISMQKYEEFEYWANGKMNKCEYTPFRAVTSDGGERLWLYVGTHNSTSGAVNSILLFEKGKEPRWLMEDANLFDFWRERAVFAYCTPRETSTLGKLQVWTSALHVGDWKKGTDKAIVKGLVWVPSVSLRP